MRLTFPLVLNLVLILALSGCRTNSAVEKKPPISIDENAPLVDAAYETYNRYRRAMHGYGGEDPVPDEIPSQHWAEGIKKLKPLKVYKHGVNIVVVRKIRDNVEQGKYIFIPVSSHFPMDGVDGFTIRPNPIKGNKYYLGDGIFDYQRRIEY